MACREIRTLRARVAEIDIRIWTELAQQDETWGHADWAAAPKAATPRGQITGMPEAETWPGLNLFDFN